MRKFKWTAKDENGSKHSGELEAKSLSAVRIQIRSQGFRQVRAKEIKPLFLFGSSSKKAKEKNKKNRSSGRQTTSRVNRQDLSIKRKKPEPKKKGDIQITWGPFGDIPFKDLLVFSKKLATMIRSGLPLVDAMQLTKEQSKGNMQRVAGEILDDINAGRSLSEAMRKQRRHFDTIYLNMIEAGEITGNLDVFLDKIVEILERQKKIKSGIKSALFYPIALVSITLLITIFMLTNVVPIFKEMFENLGAKLPPPTQLLVDISDFLLAGNNLLAIVGALVAAIAINKVLTKNVYAIRKFKSYIFLKLPLFGPLITKASIARIALLMGNLFKASVSIVDILKVSSNSTDNIMFKEALEEIKLEVASGVPLSVLFEEQKVFPPELSQLVRVGEETGNMEEMLNSIANYYQEEFDAVVEGISSIIEPLMIVMVGAVVGGLILAMYMPIFTAGDLVK